MRAPLIRQGEGPAAAFQRLVREEAEQQQKIERICAESGVEPNGAKYPATAAGDWRKLRGIPVQAKGVSGNVVGTDPLATLLAKERAS